MNVNGNPIQSSSRMEEAPGTRPAAGRATTPSDLLAILKPDRQEPPAILIGSLWKTGLVPEGAVS